ncbi:MAG: Crp/Fnr family transcriptional regulator [Acidobacteriota bacterium]
MQGRTLFVSFLTYKCGGGHRKRSAEATIVFFVNVDVMEAPLLGASQSLQHRAAGETLFLEGELPGGAYILYNGQVDLVYSSENGDVKNLCLALAGQILAMSDAVMGRPHEFSAATRTACEIGFIGRDTLLALLAADPSVWLTVLRMLSHEVNSAYDDLRALAS